MSFTLEQVEQLTSRMNITYEQAKEALSQTEGDVLEAVIYLENKGHQKKGTQKSQVSHFKNQVLEVLQKLHAISLSVTKEDRVILNIPLTFVILMCLFVFPLVLVVTAILLFTGHQFDLKHKEKTVMKPDNHQ